MSATVQSALAAGAGALAVQLLNLAEVARLPKDQRPDLKEWLYWLPFLIHPLLGAGLGCAYALDGSAMTTLMAINIGASAPALLKSLAATLPSPKSDAVD